MKQKGHDYSTVLIWAAAAVSIVRYIAAFIASDMGEIEGSLSTAITYFMAISGLGMGLLTVMGQTYTFDGWRRSLPKAGQKWTFRFVLLTFFVFALMAVDVAILVPFTVSRVEHVSMADLLARGELYWWSALVNVAPALLIAGVALGNQVVTVTQKETTESDRKVSESLPTDWRKVRKLLKPEEVNEIAHSMSGAIAYKYGVSERTARNWRVYAQKEVEK